MFVIYYGVGMLIELTYWTLRIVRHGEVYKGVTIKHVGVDGFIFQHLFGFLIGSIGAPIILIITPATIGVARFWKSI